MHHVVNRSKLRGNDAARRFCERQHHEIFLAVACEIANVSRLADSDEAQAILLAGKIALFGEQYVREVWSEFEALWTSEPLRLDGILHHLPPDAPRPVV